MNCGVNGHKKLNISELNARLKAELEEFRGEEMRDEEEE